MFIIKLKDIVNFFKKIIIVLLILFVFVNGIKKIDFENLNLVSKLKIMNQTLVIASYEKENEFQRINHSKKLLSSKEVLFSLERVPKQEEKSNIIIEEVKDKQEKVVQAQKINYLEDVETNIISDHNIEDTYTRIYHNVKIKNESSYSLTEEILDFSDDIENKTDIIIYHTHTCESYTPTKENNYEQTSNFRTTNLDFTVAKVGEVLANNLKNFGFHVIHDETYHDYPAYTGSYTRALTTINNLLQIDKADIVIDLHRDALGNLSSYAPTVQIGDEVVAQVMFVIGTDGGDLEHPNWRANLKNAIKIQEKANEMYPGLFRAIIVRNSRYNQHVAKGACIIEVGATGNTLEQCLGSMKYLANILSEVYQ